MNKNYKIPAIAVLVLVISFCGRNAAVQDFCANAWSIVANHYTGNTTNDPCSVVIIDDVSNATVWFGKIRADASLPDYYAKSNSLFRIIDKQETGKDIADVQWALDKIKSSDVKLPALLIKKGNTVTIKTCPQTKDLIISTVKKVAGI